MRALRRLIARLRGYDACKWCGAYEPPVRLLHGTCVGCARDSVAWIQSVGGSVTWAPELTAWLRQ